MVRASDSPAQLMELCQSEFVGPLNDDGVGVGNIDTRLNDRRAHENVMMLVVEVRHHPLK